MGDIIKCTVCGGNLRMVTENEVYAIIVKAWLELIRSPKK